jgi:cell division protein FtsL
MTRLNIVLLVAVVLSALYLVQMQYESRRLFIELDRAHTEAGKLSVEYQRLQVERRAQATPLRVEKLARDQLKMRTATPAITHYVRYAATPLAATSAASASQGTTP